MPKNVRIDPKVQQRLLEQMREEQAASSRARKMKLFVGLPAVIALMVWSVLLFLSPDSTSSTIGGLLVSSFLLLLWKIRKQIPGLLGLE